MRVQNRMTSEVVKADIMREWGGRTVSILSTSEALPAILSVNGFMYKRARGPTWGRGSSLNERMSDSLYLTEVSPFPILIQDKYT
jgi:hypothetical protein